MYAAPDICAMSAVFTCAVDAWHRALAVFGRCTVSAMRLNAMRISSTVVSSNVLYSIHNMPADAALLRRIDEQCCNMSSLL
jgi:hypothetical protein